MDYRECVQKVLSMVGMMEIQAIDYRGHVRKYVLSMARIMEIQAARDNQCCSIHSHSFVFVLGLLLAVSGILRFWIPLEDFLYFQPLPPLLLLVFNWITCILLEYVATVELFFQIPWNHLRWQKITKLRYFALILVFSMGLVSVYSMWQLCLAVYDCVSSNSEELVWVLKFPLWAFMLTTICTAMCHSLLLAICVPVQMMIIPLKCNKDVPNINFKSRHITLTVNCSLFVHFVYLCINYSYYNVVALFYRFCCAIWMFLYCHPEQTYNTYHFFKQLLPKCIRPFLRFVRDSELISRVWRNLRVILARRRREEYIVDYERSQILINYLWTKLYEKRKFLLLYVISSVSVGSLLMYYTGWDSTVVLPSVMLVLANNALILYLILRHYYPDPTDNITHTFNNSHYGMEEKFIINPPTCCSDEDDINLPIKSSINHYIYVGETDKRIICTRDTIDRIPILYSSNPLFNDLYKTTIPS